MPEDGVMPLRNHVAQVKVRHHSECNSRMVVQDVFKEGKETASELIKAC